MVTMVTTKISQSYFRCVKLFIHKILSSYQVYRRKYSRLFIVDMCIYHFWRHTIYCSSVCTNPLKNIFGFLSFFLVKFSKSRSLKLNISRTAWPILMILVSFCRILNGRSDEINLFWRCSSPLTAKNLSMHPQKCIMIGKQKYTCVIQIQFRMKPWSLTVHTQVKKLTTKTYLNTFSRVSRSCPL